ncbi:MAG: DUF4215 domain-containing protein [Deltaproteobacteria bacterium]|nr:DUF4215 domain-containing protein [Deltaproteobacteria bacterium]
MLRGCTHAALAALLMLAACGDNAAPAMPDGGVGPDAGDPDGCRVVTLGEPDFQFNLFGQLTGLRYPVTPNLEGAAADVLRVELYDSTTGGLPPLATGTFDLGAAPDDDLATCQHCVWLSTDDQPDAALGIVYYQAAGSLTLTQVADPIEPVFAGKTSRVVLRRATVTTDGHVQLVDGGDCVAIDGVDFDTAPTPGRSCLSAEDCGNALLEVCDPASNTCGDPQCGEFQSCPDAGQICLTQYHELFQGACYTSCDPRTPAAGCAAPERCIQLGVDPGLGICKTVGGGAVGAACAAEDNATACAIGAVCSSVTSTCAATCAFYDAAPGCPDDRLCSLFGVCEPPTAGSPVALGEACGAGAALADGCGPDGEAFRGVCFGYRPEDPLICERACLGDLGCGVSEFCAVRFTSGLGVCKPLPVCGDGALGEINELCDDGNQVDGDGCSADCQTVEYGVICAQLAPLAVDSIVTGDTAAARDGFMSSCQFGSSRAALFAVTPPGPGRLRLHLTSPTDQTLSLRSACADATSEVACAERANAGATEELVVQITDAAPTALTAMVSGSTLLEEGPFTLSADFVAEDCGDGIIAGNEVCDDSNTTSNDGCRGDCRAIEYDYYCAQAAPLDTSAANTGDTTGAPHLYENSCSNPAGTGPDRLYSYVAPSAGTLSLRLDQGVNDLALAVFDGCGAPAQMTELACSSVVDVEAADVTLTAGQHITIVVDGFSSGSQGPYSLTATFTPQ